MYKKEGLNSVGAAVVWVWAGWVTAALIPPLPVGGMAVIHPVHIPQ